jgi:NAD(P)-dependent dehydrogenase (short-subunit alcohol dehydrogenase family)
VADAVVAEIRSLGGIAIPSYDSVCSRARGESIVRTALNEFGRVDILVNNAGNLRSAAFDEITDDDWESLYRTHLKGQFNVAQPAYKAMKKQSYGRILFVASAVGLFGGAYQAAYGAAKAGVVGMMHSLANEASAHGVVVNALLPTAMSRMAEQVDDRALAFISKVPAEFFAKGMDPDFNVPLVAYLVSDANQTTHAIYSSAGGRYARVFIGVTNGWQGPREHPATAEDVFANIERIENRSQLSEFHSVADEFIGVNKLLAQQARDRKTNERS